MSPLGCVFRTPQADNVNLITVGDQCFGLPLNSGFGPRIVSKHYHTMTLGSIFFACHGAYSYTLLKLEWATGDEKGSIASLAGNGIAKRVMPFHWQQLSETVLVI
jgi:hypothetical protein